MRRVLAAATVAVLLIGGCGDDSSSEKETSKSAQAQTEPVATIEGCAPQCLTPNITEPGEVPEGTYTTEYFFAGQMKVVFDKGWAVGEDSTGELLASTKINNSDLHVIFWEDVFPTRHKHGVQRVKGVPLTAAGVVGWLRANRNLAVTKPRKGMIGSDLPATVIDVKVAPEADNDDPGCPAKPCANFLGFPQWETPYGLAQDSGSTRLYLSDVKYGGKTHLFVAALEGIDKAEFKARLPAAKRLIESTKVPAKPA